MKKLILGALLILPFLTFSQDKEDEKKIIRDIVTVEVERAKYAPKVVAPTPTIAPVVEGKKGKKKPVVVEPVVVEEVVDTLPPLMPAPQAEILKRAQAWYTLKTKKFIKAGGTNSGKSVTCNVTFNFKQKILNPENDVDGKITMDVIIEAKEGKYRYTIKNIKHKSNAQGMSGGDIYAEVPECGSMKLNDRTWKLVRAESYACTKIVVDDLKAVMKQEVDANKDEW